jgi:hypothetical protein
MRQKLAAITTAMIALGLSSSAQITSTVDMNSLTVEQLVHTLTGPENGLQVWNETYTGHATAAGQFFGGSSVFGPLMDEGIILSSGDIHGDCGPANNNPGYSTDHQLAGDVDLNALVTPYPTHDAAVLEFDFSCADLQEISFLFVFTSEEYNEYVFSQYNDVFAFFLDGVNIALLPVAGTVPVAVNNVNHGSSDLFSGYTYNVNPPPVNPGYYLNNVDDPFTGETADCQFLPFQMDGMTVVLAAFSALGPPLGTGPTGDPAHHMKFAIADTSDFILDSAVFIAANTFNCGDPLVVELDHFVGRMDRSGNVLLSWATLAEIDNVGFNVYREPWSNTLLQAPSAAALLVNPSALIPARGTPFEATPYRWLDRSGQRGDVYYYWLEDIDTSGVSTIHGPITVR